MARAGQNLFLRKTLRAAGSTTFNSPGNYLPPYGSTVIKIGGRGASGNPNVPGNTVPGNYSGSNPGYPGNVSGSNPSTLANHNYGTWMYTGHIGTVYSPTPPGAAPDARQFFPNINAPNPPGANYDGGHGGHPQPWQYAAPYYQSFGIAPHGQHYGQQVQWNGATYTGSANYTPGNPNYNPYTPGNPNYNPTTNNPTTPGNAGTSVNIEGVTFPGGPIASTAPTVPQTATSITYTGSNISITVPSGGYVTIENV